MVYVDLDGVVADFVSGLCARKGWDNPYWNEENHGKWEICELMGERWEDVEQELDYSFWVGLDVMDDADDIMRFARGLSREVAFYSTLGWGRGGAGEGKRDWVKKWFPGVSLLLIGIGEKWEGVGAGWLLDDRGVGVREWRRRRGRGILVPRPWNELWKWTWEAREVEVMERTRKMYETGKL